ncbi:MAG: ABC transporter permease subunit [Acidimicrobiia bacterium]
MRLIEVEARRFVYRDAIRAIGGFLLLVLFAVGIGTFITANAVLPSDAAKFDRLIKAERKLLPEAIEKCSKTRLIDQMAPSARQNLSEDLRRRLSRRRSYNECRSMLAFSTSVPSSNPTQTTSLSNDTRFHLLNVPIAIRFGVFPFWMLSWVIGATIIGAEWSAGTLRNILTWDPRRLRVMAAKVLVPTVLTGIGFTVFVALLFVSVLPTVTAKGSAVGIDALWWTETLFTVLRGFAVSAVGVLFGFGLGMLIRRTVAAVGILFIYFMVLENVLRQFTREFDGWLLTTNLGVLASGYDFTGSDRPFVVSVLILGGYLAILLGIAVVLFLRRDAD